MKEIILDTLYPPTCVSCGSDGVWLCPSCLARVILFRGTLCRHCGESRHEHICQSQWNFRSIVSIGPYHDPILRNIITKLKYHSASCLDLAFEKILRRFRDEFSDAWPWAGLDHLTIVPISSELQRIKQLGFDHTEILSRLIQRILIPWADHATVFLRSKSEFRNASLPLDASRQENVRSTFHLLKNIDGPILLVDDVLTTGATVNEAASTLKTIKAEDIYVLTFAKR